MAKVEIVVDGSLKRMTTQDLKIGEVGRLREQIIGGHVMRVYNRFVLLEEPSNVWSETATLEIDQIFKLGSGSVIKLTL